MKAFSSLTYILLLLGLNSSLDAQFISRVIDYVPAPSQYMNASPWGTPSSANSIIGGLNGAVSLGAFGGYIVFQFDQAVENDPQNPYGVDFTIFSNPMPGWSEPGIVSVMKDENRNGLADDTWYELAGSDFHFSSTIRDYQVTYSNPFTDYASDVEWYDNIGNTGFVEANSFYLQSYFPIADSFPQIHQDKYSLSGTMIKSTVDTSFESGIYSLKRAFGYVDNQFRGKEPYTLPDNPYTQDVENSGGDAFDISWAVDQDGKYVELDQVDFIKVHTGVMDGAGLLGQISTEITGAIDVSPDSTFSGNSEILVIREIPQVIDTSSYQLEVFAFLKGRLQKEEHVKWTSSLTGAHVDENDVLRVNESGNLTLTASLIANQQVSTSISTVVNLNATPTISRAINNTSIRIYPNPAKDYVIVRAAGVRQLILIDISGKTLMHSMVNEEEIRLDVNAIPSGIYFLQLVGEFGTNTEKFLKL